METKYKIEGHTVEVRISGTGSCDPWSQAYADKIGVSLMCTADMAVFMLVDDSRVFRLEDWSLGHGDALRDALQSFPSWDAFEREWLQAAIKRGTVTERGTLEESRAHLDEARRRERVWKAMPQTKRREVYEHLKTLGPEDVKDWYRERYKALGIE